MPRVTELKVFGQVTLDGSGNGTVTLAVPGIERWNVKNYSVSVSSDTVEPTAIVYRNTVAATAQISGTRAGSNDTDDAVNKLLQPGERLICVWTGGDAGAVAAFNCGGEKYS